MSIQTYYFYQAGSIPGVSGSFPAGTAVDIDNVAMTVVATRPIGSNVPTIVQLLSQTAATATSMTLQTAATGTGNGSSFPVSGMGSVAFTITGTFSATITWEGSEDGTNYFSILATNYGSTVSATTATTTGIYLAGCSGLQNVRAHITAYTSGSITVTAHAVPLGGGGSSGGGGGGGSVSISDGSDVAQGTTTDAAWSLSGSGTVIALLKKMDLLINAFGLDNTNEMKVSVYGKNSTAGDTPLGLDSSGRLSNNIVQIGGSSITLGSKTSANSYPVVVASDQAAIPIQHGNVVDAGNSSTATLTGNSVFTGTGTSSLNYSAISIEIFADQNSAAGGLSIQQSQDNSHYDTVDTFTITANTAFNTVVNLVGQYYKIVYTNGSTNQGAFRLQTVKMVADVVLPRTLSAIGGLKVDGPVASAATNAGNPLKTGGAFNTTQPTVSNGQLVDAQYTNRGAALVATGVDQFSVNDALWNGAVNAPTNPVIVEQNLNNWIRNGNVYVAPVERAAGGTGNFGLSLFSTSTNTKNILIYAVEVWNGGGTTVFLLQTTTTDPALNTTLTAINSKLGGGASTLTSTTGNITYNTATGSVPGTLYSSVNCQNSQTVQMLQNGATILLPSGANNGIAVYSTGTNGTYGITVRWAEY